MTIKEREDGLGEFVEREIYTCQSMLIEESFRKQLFSIDDIDNLYRPFDGMLIKPAVCSRCTNEFHCLDSETGECEACFEESQEPQEIFEWWIVSPWLSKRLLMEGQPILDNGYGVWWGRVNDNRKTVAISNLKIKAKQTASITFDARVNYITSEDTFITTEAEFISKDKKSIVKAPKKEFKAKSISEDNIRVK